jgi:hypothetical protein
VWRALASRPDFSRGAAGEAVRLAINAGVLRRQPRGSAQSALGWLRAPAPFYRDSILELPVIAPLDCDLLGLPLPTTPTPAGLLDYTRFALQACIAPDREFSMITFHDWIVAGANRLALLEELLGFLSREGVRPVSVEERWSELSAIGRGTPPP